MLAINKASNTHNKVLLGVAENTSEANVTRKLHQQKSWETNAVLCYGEIMGRNGKNKGKVRIKLLSYPLTIEISPKTQRTS